MSTRFYRCIALGIAALAMLLVGSGSDRVVAAELAATSSGQAKTQTVELNSATVEQLTALPGIGKITAERIVAFRTEHGPFTRVEDLMKVKGIGEKSFSKLRDHVRVADAR